jgi:phosphatidylethanolamine-binding protein (PEBP) family uncharacterized protein
MTQQWVADVATDAVLAEFMHWLTWNIHIVFATRNIKAEQEGT